MRAVGSSLDRLTALCPSTPARGKRTCFPRGSFPPRLPRQGPCRKDSPRGIAVCVGWAGWAPVSQGSFWKVQLGSAGSFRRESFRERSQGPAQRPVSGQEGEVHRPALCAWGHTPEPGGPGTQAAYSGRGPAPRVTSVGWGCWALWVPLSVVQAHCAQAGGRQGHKQQARDRRPGTRVGVPDQWLCSRAVTLGAQEQQPPALWARCLSVSTAEAPSVGGGQGRAWGRPSLLPAAGWVRGHRSGVGEVVVTSCCAEGPLGRSFPAQTCCGGWASLQGPQGQVDPPLALLAVAGGSVLGAVDKVKGQRSGAAMGQGLGRGASPEGWPSQAPGKMWGRCGPRLSGGALGVGWGLSGAGWLGLRAAGRGPQRVPMASGPHLGSPPERSILWPLAGWGHLGQGSWKGSPARLFP